MSKPLSHPRQTHLGRRLQTLREHAGISARALSEKIGVTASVISQIESGRIQDPTGTILTAIASELGTTVEWLVTGRKPKATGTDGN